MIWAWLRAVGGNLYIIIYLQFVLKSFWPEGKNSGLSEDKIGDFFRFPPRREEHTRGLVCAVVVMRSQIVCPVRRGEERRAASRSPHTAQSPSSSQEGANQGWSWDLTSRTAIVVRSEITYPLSTLDHFHVDGRNKKCPVSVLTVSVSYGPRTI